MLTYKLILFLFLFCCSDISLAQQSVTVSYIQKYKNIAIAEMKKFHIPASIKLAQAILESGSGESKLAKKAKNHFGIKCHNNWGGKTFYQDDDEKNECFRRYRRVGDSFRDHSFFLSQRSRYSLLFDLSLNDYKAWAYGLQQAGYATNSKYAHLLINIIEKYELHAYDIYKQEKSLIFTASGGFPYLIGAGLNYHYKGYMLYADVQSGIIFGNISLGYAYNWYKNFYTGINTGAVVSYVTADGNEANAYQISGELIYKLPSSSIDRSLFLIKIGIQVIPFESSSLYAPSLEYFQNRILTNNGNFIPYITFVLSTRK